LHLFPADLCLWHISSGFEEPEDPVSKSHG
jgi:hypothetical protein